MKLLAGMASGPVAWLAQMSIAYPIAQLACRPGPGDHNLVSLHIVSVVALLFAFGGAVMLRRTPASNGRARFMSRLGILGCVLFAFIVVAVWMPVFFLHDCTP